VEDSVPPWWRPYWGVVALGILTLLLIDEDYSLIVPWLAESALPASVLSTSPSSTGANRRTDTFDEHRSVCSSPLILHAAWEPG